MNFKLKNLSQDETDNILPENLILLAYRGSIAHGTYITNKDPDSIDDKDIMGVFIAPKDHYLGINNIKETKEKFYKEWDCVYYELRKLIFLLIKGNPNVLSMLWIKERNILYNTKYGELLRKNKDLFVSKQVYHSFIGYAYGQFHRMTHFKFEGYMGEKRKTIVNKFGYDIKNASHLIRLLKMGIEFLTEGILYVEREKDASLLIEIKKGEWSFDKVKEYSESLFKSCEQAYINCKLPNEPKLEEINKLCINIIEDYFKDSYGGQLL